MTPTLPLAVLFSTCALLGQSRDLLELLQRDDWSTAVRSDAVARMKIAAFADALAPWPQELDAIDLRVRAVAAQRRDELLQLWRDEPQARQRRAPVFSRVPRLLERYGECEDEERRDLDLIADLVRTRATEATLPLWLDAATLDERCAAFARLVATARDMDAWRELHRFELDPRGLRPEAPIWFAALRADLAAALADADVRVASRARFVLRTALRLPVPMELRERLARDPSVAFSRAAARPDVVDAIVAGWIEAIDGGMPALSLFADFAPYLGAVTPVLRQRLASRVFDAAKRELAADPGAARTPLPGTAAAEVALRTAASIGAEGLTMVLALAASAENVMSVRRAMTAAASSMMRHPTLTTNARIDGLLLGLLDHEDEYVASQAAMVVHRYLHAPTPTFREALWQRSQLALDRGIMNLGMPLRDEWRGKLPRATPKPIPRDVSVVLATAAAADTRLLPSLLTALPVALGGRPPHVVDSEHLRFLLACFEHLAPHVDSAQAKVLFDLLHPGAEQPGASLLPQRCRSILNAIAPVVPAECLPWYERRAGHDAHVRSALQVREMRQQPAEPRKPPIAHGGGEALPEATPEQAEAAARLARAHWREQLQTAAAQRLWKLDTAAQVIEALRHADPAVRLAAYETLLTRDPRAWPQALLAFEARFDDDAAVRAFGERLVR